MRYLPILSSKSSYFYSFKARAEIRKFGEEKNSVAKGRIFQHYWIYPLNSNLSETLSGNCHRAVPVPGNFATISEFYANLTSQALLATITDFSKENCQV